MQISQVLTLCTSFAVEIKNSVCFIFCKYVTVKIVFFLSFGFWRNVNHERFSVRKIKMKKGTNEKMEQ